MKKCLCALLAAAILVSLSSRLLAEDWPQWRGPDRNGIAPNSQPLLDTFSKDTLKKLWTSEPIPSALNGGWSSVVIVNGKAYVYANYNPQYKWRMVSKDAMAAQGYYAEMPAELSAKVEAARITPERNALKETAIPAWIDKWIAANAPDALPPCKDAIRSRLVLGPQAIKLEYLEKLVPIVGRKFDPADLWSKWVKQESGLDATGQEKVRDFSYPMDDVCDYLYCLDVATGKTLWKTRFSGPGVHSYYPNSGTPTITGGKVYVFSSDLKVCCFDTADGKLLWAGPTLGQANAGHPRSSSPLVSEGVAAVITPRALEAIDISTSQSAWTTTGVGSEFSSAATWSTAGKTYFIVAGGGNVALVDPKTGKRIAGAKGGGYGTTAAVVGDYAAASAGDQLRAYKISPTSVEQLWSVPFKEQFTSPLIYNNYVYALGGGEAGWKQEPKGKALCVELQSGKIAWEEPLPMAQLASPILADGKILAVVGPELVCLKATPEKFEILGRADLGLEPWSSPALADGKIFLRTATTIVCYDLAKH